MGEQVERVSITRLTEAGATRMEDVVVREHPLTIVLNDQELVTLLCSPSHQKELAAGFLFSEGFINSREEVRSIILNEATGVVRVQTEGDDEAAREAIFSRLITSGCGRGASFYQATDLANQRVESALRVPVGRILALVREFQRRSETYRATGGVHSAALCDTGHIIAFAEDIGRHNAVDKVFGACLLEGTPTTDRLLITSGRISSEILLKVARRAVPVLVSKSAPTSMGVKMAEALGITLVGFVRGRRVNVYTSPGRVTATA